MILEEGWEGGDSEKRTGLGPWGLFVVGSLQLSNGVWMGVDSGVPTLLSSLWALKVSCT